jgi:hypothetical protein
MVKPVFVLSIFILFLSGCASLSARNKTLLTMAASGTAGAIIGAQQNSHKRENTALFATTGAASGAVLGLLVFDPDQEKTELRTKSRALEKELHSFKQNSTVVAEGSSTLSAPIPDDLRGLISPGKWRRYKLDQWVPDTEENNVWYRQTEKFEVIPPATAN